MPQTKNPESTKRVQRFLARGSFRAVLPYFAAGAAMLLSVAVVGREVEHHIDAVESWIASLGPWGGAAFAGLFALGTSLFLPDTLLCIIAGALFGLKWGTMVVVAGNLFAVTLQYMLSRRLLLARIRQVLAKKPALAAIQRAVLQDEFRLQILLRLTPINPATISYLLGAAGVRYFGFLTASLALIPSLFIEVYFGHAGTHMVRIAGSATRTMHLRDAALIGGLAACIAVIVLVSRMARKALAEAVAAAEAVSFGETL